MKNHTETRQKSLMNEIQDASLRTLVMMSEQADAWKKEYEEHVAQCEKEDKIDGW